jgi:iron complex transport system ATP-binding protein
MELLVDLNRRDGATIVAVLHDLNLAARYFPRILVVNGGGIAADGLPADALSGERIRDVFRVEPWLLNPPWATEPTAAGAR